MERCVNCGSSAQIKMVESSTNRGLTYEKWVCGCGHIYRVTKRGKRVLFIWHYDEKDRLIEKVEPSSF